MLKAIRIIDRVSDFVLVLFSLLLVCIGSYTMYDTMLIYNQSNNTDLKTYRPMIIETDGKIEWDMSALSEDVVAWITVEDTTLDYPILQGSDNTEYLSKDPFGKYSLSGSIFLDFRNASDFSDKYSLVYGHHMSHGAMFGCLDEFIDKDYFDNHRDGSLIVGDRSYKVRFFALVIADASVDEIFIPDNNLDTLGYVRKHAQIFYEPESERLIALSTCRFPATTERTILFGVII